MEGRKPLDWRGAARTKYLIVLGAMVLLIAVAWLPLRSLYLFLREARIPSVGMERVEPDALGLPDSSWVCDGTVARQPESHDEVRLPIPGTNFDVNYSTKASPREAFCFVRRGRDVWYRHHNRTTCLYRTSGVSSCSFSPDESRVAFTAYFHEPSGSHEALVVCQLPGDLSVGHDKVGATAAVDVYRDDGLPEDFAVNADWARHPAYYSPPCWIGNEHILVGWDRFGLVMVDLHSGTTRQVLPGNYCSPVLLGNNWVAFRSNAPYSAMDAAGRRDCFQVFVATLNEWQPSLLFWNQYANGASFVSASKQFLLCASRYAGPGGRIPVTQLQVGASLFVLNLATMQYSYFDIPDFDAVLPGGREPLPRGYGSHLSWYPGDASELGKTWEDRQ